MRRRWAARQAGQAPARDILDRILAALEVGVWLRLFGV
jgi:hypothetical protein